MSASSSQDSLIGGRAHPQAQSHKPLLRARTRFQRLEDSSLFPQSLQLRELRSRAQAPALQERGREGDRAGAGQRGGDYVVDVVKHTVLVAVVLLV